MVKILSEDGTPIYFWAYDVHMLFISTAGENKGKSVIRLKHYDITTPEDIEEIHTRIMNNDKESNL